MRHIYSSLDIGSDRIKLIVCELYKNKLNLLAATSTPSIGIKRGLITDAEAARSSIKKAVDEVESMLGISIKKIAVTVPSYKADFSLVKGNIKIENDASIITGKDVSEVLENALATKKQNGYEIVTSIPIDFKVDDKNGVKEPRGLIASNLDVRAIKVSVPSKNLISVLTVLESLNIEVVEALLNPISDMEIFKTEDIKTSVSSIINIGHETTTVSLYNKGILIKNSVLPIGSTNVDNDLAYIYKTTQKTAREVKENFALAHKRNASLNDFYETVNTLDEKIKISQFEASEIVMARLEEILTLARKEITNLTSNSVDNIIITGGISNMTDFEYIANDIFGKKLIIGNIKLLGIRSNTYSVALGTIMSFINRLKLIGKEYSMFKEETTDREFTVEENSMLDKVFGYFSGD